jgi:hypothetical protein
VKKKTIEIRGKKHFLFDVINSVVILVVGCGMVMISVIETFNKQINPNLGLFFIVTGFFFVVEAGSFIARIFKK